MHPLARLLQLAGLAGPPLAILGQLTETLSVRDMLIVLVASACAFWIGRILEGYSRP